LSFTHNDDGEYAHESHLDGLPSLRELQLRSCRGMDRGGLQNVVRSLQDLNLDAFDVLDRVVIHDCDLLDYETAAEVIGKEKLDFAR